MVIRDVDEAKRVWDALVRNLVDATQGLEDRDESKMRRVINDMERDVEDAWDKMVDIIEEAEK